MPSLHRGGGLKKKVMEQDEIKKMVREAREDAENMTPEDIEALIQRLEEKHKNDPVLSKTITLERKDLLRVLNGSYIAYRFFQRSASWFSQKLNNSVVNGVAREFTADEMQTLANALYTIALELEELADELQETAHSMKKAGEEE